MSLISHIGAAAMFTEFKLSLYFLYVWGRAVYSGLKTKMEALLFIPFDRKDRASVSQQFSKYSWESITSRFSGSL